VLFCQVITIDPSKHCHAVKQIADTADDCEKHVEELTWQLEDTSCRQSSTFKSRISADVHSERVASKSPHSVDTKLNQDLCGTSKMEIKQKKLPSESKSRVCDDSNLQERQVKSKSLSPCTKKLKLGSSPNKTAKLEKMQKVVRNKSASFNESDVDKLSHDKKQKRAGADVMSDKKRDFSKLEVQMNGNQDYCSKEETGVVSFADEAETGGSAAACRQTPLSHAQQDAVYNEYASVVLDEYVDREPARNVGRYSSSWRTDHDSSDEDVFDLIASGRINKVVRQWQGSQLVSPRQTDLSGRSAAVDQDPMTSQHHTVDREVDNYDSASSADTDVIIRSHRLISEVKANLQHQSVSSFKPNLNTALSITSKHGNASSQQLLSNVRENVSPSQILAQDGCSTVHKQKRKGVSGTSSEAAVKHHADDPVLPDSTSVVDKNIVSKGLPEICRSTERKRKQKLLKANNLEATVKIDTSNADSSPVQTSKDTTFKSTAPKCTALPNIDDAHSSKIKQRKTDVSVLLT